MNRLLRLPLPWCFSCSSRLPFVISCAASAQFASEQEAAIYSRYLDALDQKVEQECLESAILVAQS